MLAVASLLIWLAAALPQPPMFGVTRLANTSAAIPLGAAPMPVTGFCRQRARRGTFPVLCPTRYPLAPASRVTASGQSLLGPSFYWGSFNDAAGFDDGDDGHLILGGQRPPFSLAGSHGQTWPRPGQPRPVQQLPLPRLITTPMAGGRRYTAQRPARILRRTSIRGHDALVLVAPAYPQGGFMGGHVIILWNWHQHGYVLSLHFDGSRNGRAYALPERVAAALAVAASFAPVAR
jgi:hypothetical protein